jgi:transposase-like protein
MTKRWNKKTREQAVRLVLEHSHKYSSKWAAITIVAERLGMSPESLSSCIRQYQL